MRADSSPSGRSAILSKIEAHDLYVAGQLGHIPGNDLVPLCQRASANDVPDFEYVFPPLLPITPFAQESRFSS